MPGLDDVRWQVVQDEMSNHAAVHKNANAGLKNAIKHHTDKCARPMSDRLTASELDLRVYHFLHECVHLVQFMHPPAQK